MKLGSGGQGPCGSFLKVVPIGALLAGVAICMLADAARAVPVVTAASGAGAPAIQAAVDGFRAALGTLNPNVAGSLGSGRREINWDGVPDTLAAPNAFPSTFFNIESPRGAFFTTPGTGFKVSANAASGTPVEFGNIDPAYPSLFTSFSAPRLFSAVGSNVLDVFFLAAGTASTATVSGFGAVFTDVDLPGVSSLEFFDAEDRSLGVFSVPAAAGDETLSFLGVAFTTERAHRVRITAGNTALAPGVTAGDLVALDDFIYGEPIPLSAAPIPEPSTTALMALGLAVVALAARRRTARLLSRGAQRC